MNVYHVREYDDNSKVKLIYSKNGVVKRMLTIKIGDVLKVAPDNPLKKKHRDRICEIKGFVKDDIGYKRKALVKFHDTKKVGRVDLSDLVTI